LIFQPRPGQRHLGKVWSDPRNRSDKREEDHNLYFDEALNHPIVVEEVEYTRGGNTSCNHEVYTLAEYLARYPERGPDIDRLLKAKDASTSP